MAVIMKRLSILMEGAMLERNTKGPGSEVESAILQKLEQTGACTFDDLFQALPDFTWNQVFAAVDRLSRNGTLLLQRPTRFDYVVAVGMRRAS